MNKLKQAGITLAASAILALGTLQVQSATSAIDEAHERAAINKVLVQYTTGLDTLNADIYVDAFAADGKFFVGETVNEGHEAIRKIITDLQDSRKERAEQAKAEGREYQDPLMHHVMTNAVIDIVDETTATHHAYWMTVIGSDRTFNVASMGHYEDTLKKIDGEWKISERHLLR
jgi:hypothetical protein